MKNSQFRVAIIGAGAAGFFAAIAIKENYPQSQVIIFEKTNRVLSKVAVSGGGRCNLTNGCSDPQELSKAYPRGGKELKRLFYQFNTTDTIEWFEKKGVPLVTQQDNCVFPSSQDSRSITDLLQKECRRLAISIKTECDVKKLSHIEDNKIELSYHQNSRTNQPTTEAIKTEQFHKVIVTTGGSPKRRGLDWLEKLGHKIIEPVPSLFTFNIPKDPIRDLMGVVVHNVILSLQGTKLKSQGTVLITHWGMSGPAVLKLSSYAARLLNEKQYDFTIQVNWTGQQNNQVVINYLKEIAKNNPSKQLLSIKPYNLTQRVWEFLLVKQGITLNKAGDEIERRWAQIGKKGLNQIAEVLTNDQYNVKGKASFKEEFVTCGGISLKSVNMSTMQSKILPNLYFAGEVLDIDAITGGFNLQAAWTTA
ncbi:MAG: NAD(P)/FAD-dependent oxidoreductase, partial [Bacteroidales bacterium]